MDGERKGKLVDCHDDFERILVTGDTEELNELKGWLFRENIRLEMERSEFLHTQEKFIEERTRFRNEMLEVNRKLVVERKRLKQDEQFFDKKMEILKISSKSNPNSVAGAIAGLVKESNKAEMQAIGAGALNQAVKAVAIARGFVAPSGVDLVCIPAFAEVEVEGEDRTGIKLIVESRA